MFEEVDIETAKVDIGEKLRAFSGSVSEKTISHAVEIFSECGKDGYFGRTIVGEITGLKPSGASKLIKLLSDCEVIIPVTGHGKGKYRSNDTQSGNKHRMHFHSEEEIGGRCANERNQ